MTRESISASGHSLEWNDGGSNIYLELPKTDVGNAYIRVSEEFGEQVSMYLPKGIAKQFAILLWKYATGGQLP